MDSIKLMLQISVIPQVISLKKSTKDLLQIQTKGARNIISAPFLSLNMNVLQQTHHVSATSLYCLSLSQAKRRLFKLD